MSYANKNYEFMYYSIFGYIITGLFIFKYLLKAIYTVTSS
jgi:hypothetical protein